MLRFSQSYFCSIQTVYNRLLTCCFMTFLFRDIIVNFLILISLFIMTNFLLDRLTLALMIFLRNECTVFERYRVTFFHMMTFTYLLIVFFTFVLVLGLVPGKALLVQRFLFFFPFMLVRSIAVWIYKA